MTRALPLPIYLSEVAAYRAFGVSYEYGVKLLNRGVIKPDAELVSGRPLFLSDVASIERQKVKIIAYKRRVAHTKENLKVETYGR
jgi:hypothetical protein